MLVVDLVGRSEELRVVHTLIQQAQSVPAALLIGGEAGIGKTTLWRAAVAAARHVGFTVLETVGAATEVSLAFAGLADLVAGMGEAGLAGLSPLHRSALGAVITGESGPGGDERLVATAFRAALDQMSRQSPVLLAIDDAHWSDHATRLVLGFALRRVTGPVGVLGAYRTGEPGVDDVTWLQVGDTQAVIRLSLGPMSLGGLHAVVATVLGRTPPRPAMVRIHTLSGGNPFYAVELARGSGLGHADEGTALPSSLADLIRRRVGELDPMAAEAALMVAAAAEPTVAMIAAAIRQSAEDLVALLEPLEDAGVLEFDGSRLRFTHPLLAAGIVATATPAQRRWVHRCLAGVVGQPELQARHLALSKPHGDPDTLAALDAAAESAAARGAYSAAGDFVGLAIDRGGDDGVRRLRGAEYRFRAGDLDAAEALLGPVVDEMPAGFMRAISLMLLAAIRGYRDGVASVAELLSRAVAEAADHAELRTQGLLLLALATGLGDDMATCVEHARRARADADALGVASLRSQACALWAHVSFMYGLGTDREALTVALETETMDISVPVTLQASAVAAVNSAWTGELEEARAQLAELSRRCTERGNEVDVLWAAEQLTMVNLWLGRYAEAERTATEALDRAHQLDGHLPLINAHSAMAAVAACQGRAADARAAARLALDGVAAGRLPYLVRSPLTSLAFLHVSEGDYSGALQTVEPLLASFDPAHDTEIMAGAYLPDAAEALITLGRRNEAEPLIAALESNGSRLDRPWMLAVAARCRALAYAADGDLQAAQQSAERAMVHHDRLAMPLERARTLLVLGQLQRRRRRSADALSNLTAAAAEFDRLGSPLWAARAHREIARLATRSTVSALTDSELRVAERAAAGLSNKEIAATLYLSTKTVEMYLSKVYRKLAIRSRAQLAERLRTLHLPDGRSSATM